MKLYDHFWVAPENGMYSEPQGGEFYFGLNTKLRIKITWNSNDIN